MIRRRRDYIMIMIMRLGQGYVIDRGRSGLLKGGGQKSRISGRGSRDCLNYNATRPMVSARLYSP